MLSLVPFTRFLFSNLLMTLIALLVLLTAPPASGRTRISGQLVGVDNVSEVEALLPIGNYESINNSKFYPVTNHKFNFEVNITATVFMQLRVGYRRIFLVLPPSGDLRVTVTNGGSKYHKLDFEGPNAAGLSWLNTYNIEPLETVIGHGELFAALAAKTKRETLIKLARFINSQSKPLDTLYSQGRIDKSFLSLLKTDVRSKHVVNITQRLILLQGKISSKATIARYEDVIKALRQFAGPNKVENARCPFVNIFLADYYSAHDGHKTGNGPVLWGPYTPYLAAPDTIRGALLGNALVFKKVIGSNEFDYKKAYAAYEKEFPNSAHVAFLRAFKADKLPAAVSGIIRLDTVFKFASLHDVIQHFKGKPVYIDLWASWCVPCRQEFPYYKRLMPLFTKKGVTPVFISIDAPDARTAWESAITRNQLVGDHVLVNKALMADLQKLVYKKSTVSVPRYLIIDKAGKVLNWDAPRPSDPALPGIISKM